MPKQKNQGTKRTPAKDQSPRPSPASLPSRPATDGFIPPHGGYKKLLSYQKAEIVYDATV